MVKISSNVNTINCSISLTPKSTQKVLSKMKVPIIPIIAVNALNIINGASYSHLSNSSTIVK